MRTVPRRQFRSESFDGSEFGHASVWSVSGTYRPCSCSGRWNTQLTMRSERGSAGTMLQRKAGQSDAPTSHEFSFFLSGSLLSPRLPNWPPNSSSGFFIRSQTLCFPQSSPLVLRCRGGGCTQRCDQVDARCIITDLCCGGRQGSSINWRYTTAVHSVPVPLLHSVVRATAFEVAAVHRACTVATCALLRRSCHVTKPPTEGLLRGEGKAGRHTEGVPEAHCGVAGDAKPPCGRGLWGRKALKQSAL